MRTEEPPPAYASVVGASAAVAPPIITPAAATAPPDDHEPFVLPGVLANADAAEHGGCVRTALLVPAFVGMPFVLLGALLLGILRLPLICARAVCRGDDDDANDNDYASRESKALLLPGGTIARHSRPTGVRGTFPFRWLRIVTTGRGEL